MSADALTGLFGKLPAHGDFVQRNLPSAFIEIWDGWLQHYIAASQEQLGEQWLDVYLTSPIWRFMFSPGAVDADSWAGIMLPSVDKIGRYFPFSIITRLPSNISSLEFLLAQNDWFSHMEDLALKALSGDLTVDDLIEEIEQVVISYNTIYINTDDLENNNPVVINMDFEEQSPSSVSDYMLDTILKKSVASYSAWTTPGSERVSPNLFLSQGLPPIQGITAMMNGQWDWQQPYKLTAN
ncbi:Protein phosphatase ImpM [hydrothermal vent metagenome]|uniref:Protein phosphatase ImpM n=1 Tax=hydrothermal vent metagenome TaxID=652676 RepID=A0A3B0ZH84_9ZZZZ